MKYLQYQWKPRSVIVLVVSIVMGVSMVLLELTDWANQINEQGFSHGDGEGPDIPSVLKYVLPFIKEIILIGVPMSISLLIMKIFGRKKRASRLKN